MKSNSVKLMDVVKSIEKTAPRDLAASNLADFFMYAVEEVGEIAECISTAKGHKRKNIKEPTHIECVDAIIATLGLYFVCGGKRKELAEIMDRKSSKWKKRVEEYHDPKG